jgi:hypothetical protein
LNPTDTERRRVLQAIAGATLAAFSARPAGAVAQQPLAGFAEASAALTGYPTPPPSEASSVLAAFATPERRVALTRLARVVTERRSGDLDAELRAQHLERIADELVAAWYSGVVTNGKASRVVLYADAYMWSAMAFTKPMGRCGGATNYWADAPA